MISEPMVRLAQTVHLSWVKITTVSKRTETSFHLSLVTQEYHPVHQKQFLSLWYVWHKPCTYTAPKLTLSPKDRNKILHDSRHLGVPSGASKSVLEAMERLVQTVDLSCIDNYTISKRTETRSYMTHITYEFHRVRPKWFMSLRYVRCKPCTYLESRLALYPNGPKRASIWASSPRSTIWCVQNGFWGYGSFAANRAPILQWN
jgi:hypothetical protein